MSTTRHRRRSWQQIGTRAAAGIVIGADAVWTIRADNGLLHLATLALGVTAAALILTACSWATSIAWHHGRHQYLVHAAAYTPLRRPLYPISSDNQDQPNVEVPLRYANTADHWRHDKPSVSDPSPGPRPYMPPKPSPATTGAAQRPA